MVKRVCVSVFGEHADNMQYLCCCLGVSLKACIANADLTVVVLAGLIMFSFNMDKKTFLPFSPERRHLLSVVNETTNKDRKLNKGSANTCEYLSTSVKREASFTTERAKGQK